MLAPGDVIWRYASGAFWGSLSDKGRPDDFICWLNKKSILVITTDERQMYAFILSDGRLGYVFIEHLIRTP